jgi:hypothetical protein
MPEGSRILKISAETGEPCLWALVDDTAEKQDRLFLVIGTGWKMKGWPSMGSAYVGTFFVPGDKVAGLPPTLVFHVFELWIEHLAKEICIEQGWPLEAAKG